MKQKTKDCIYTASLVVCMAVGLSVSLNGIINADESPEAGNVAQVSENVGVGRDFVVPEKEPEYTEKTLVATAYCPCWECCGKTDGITSTGVKATAGKTVAVDPSVIPYGSEIVIDDHTYIAEDCGGVIKGDRIDIFFDSHTEALEFGIQTMTAKIYR